jgi:glycerophosphoryl diester phosphodiesterase
MTQKFLLYSTPFLLLFIGLSLAEPWIYRHYIGSTDIKRLKGKEFEVIAHKGASGTKLAPENTLAAIGMAMDLGVDMIEIDARFTKDGEIVVFHDETLDRTTDGTGRLEDYTLEELKKLDAGSWKDSKWADQRIPTLKEVLDSVRGRCNVLIEIKHMDHPHYHEFAAKMVDVVHSEPRGAQWILVQSYENQYLQDIHDMDSVIQTKQLLIGEDSNKAFAFYLETRMLLGHARVSNRMKALNPEYTTLSPRRVFRMHARGYKVYTYPVNTRDEMIKMLNAGVDGIITDQPDILIKLREEIRALK